MPIISKYNLKFSVFTVMQHKQRVLRLYSTGQFQCDHSFRIALLQLATQLDLHEWRPFLAGEADLTHQLLQLTELSSRQSQEDYEDEQVVSLTRQIKTLIGRINTQKIKSFIGECDDLKWESYTNKVTNLISGKPQYDEIVERIQRTVHSEQLKTDSLLFTALFYCINGEIVGNYVRIYSAMVEGVLEHLQANSKQIQTIQEASSYSNLCQLPRVKTFVVALYLALKVCIRFCEILKVLAGRNNLSLKFTSIRKELKLIMSKYPEWECKEDKDDIMAIVPPFKELLKGKKTFQKRRVCRWCFSLMQQQQSQHAFCRKLIDNRAKFITQR